MPTYDGPGAPLAGAAEARVLARRRFPEDIGPQAGSQPLRPLSRRDGEILAELRFQRLAGRFHELGPRPLAEFLTEIGAQFLIRQSIEALLARCTARHDSEILRALGADRLPAPPIGIVEGSRDG